MLESASLFSKRRRSYWTGTISPDLISLAAAAKRVGVRRLRRPICIDEYDVQINDYASIRSRCRPKPTQLRRSSGNLRQLFPGGKLCAVRVPGDCCCRIVHREEVSDLRQALVRSTRRLCHLGVVCRFCYVSAGGCATRSYFQSKIIGINICSCDDVYPAFWS
jgi:hypothetical protein